MQTQQGSIDSTREGLNTLCRKYPSEELASLGSSLTELIKTYESVNQLSARTLMSQQNCLQQHFIGELSHNLIIEPKTIPSLLLGVVDILIMLLGFILCLLRSSSGVSSLAK